MQMSSGHFVSKLSCQKLECKKATSCKIQGMSGMRAVEGTAILVIVVRMNYIVYYNSNWEILQINASNYNLL